MPIEKHWTTRIASVADQHRQGFQELSNKFDLGEINPDQFAEKLSAMTGVNQKEIIPEMWEGVLFHRQVISLLKKLKQNYKLAVLSNSNSEFINEFLERENLETIFDAEVISQEIGLIKPDPEIFKVALNKLQTSPAETLFIDDRERNVQAAEKLGIKGILYKNPQQFKDDLLKQKVLNPL